MAPKDPAQRKKLRHECCIYSMKKATGSKFCNQHTLDKKAVENNLKAMDLWVWILAKSKRTILELSVPKVGSEEKAGNKYTPTIKTKLTNT